jgi:ABC-type nickel/cobalt efflux system permease component RcnA
MFGLDDAIANLSGGGILVALAVAVLLGLRHATDPDHLTAVSTLVMSEDERGPRRAARLGLLWGLGHATTLFLVGLPLVVFGNALPGGLQTALEVAVGVVIVGLAVRLLVRWHRGYFHVHVHTHEDGRRHAHPHVHEEAHADPHAHAHSLGRTPLASFGIGLVHGAGGSAGVGVLIVAAMPGQAERVAALLILALGTALSMATVSASFGYALSRGPLLRRFERAAPAIGIFSLTFGIWYALGALQAIPYVF